MARYSLATPNGPARDKLSTSASSNCDSLLKYGRYIDDTNISPTGWQPDGCALKNYRSLHHDGLTSCLRPGDEVIFFGDSTTRQVYWGFTNILARGRNQKMDSHANLQVVIDGVTVTMVWASYFNGSTANKIARIAQMGLKAPEKSAVIKNNKLKTYKPKTFLYMATGPWFAGKEHPWEVGNRFHNNSRNILQEIDNRVDGAFDAVYFGAPLIPHYDSLDKGRTKSMNYTIIHGLVDAGDSLFDYRRTNDTVESPVSPALYTGGVRYRTRPGRNQSVSAYYFPVVNELSAENHQGIHDDMGIHFWERGFVIQANILLNHMCNQRIADATNQPLPGGTCCVKYKDTYDKPSRLGKMVSPAARRFWSKVLVGIALFGLVFAAYGFTANMALPVFKAAVYATVVLGLVATWARACNQSQLVSKTAIFYSSTEMTGLLQVWLLVSVFSVFSFSRYYTFGVASAEPAERGALTLTKYRLSEPLLAEWQGVCVSLLLIINYTGYDTIPHIFDGELLTRVLISTWALIQVYSFGLAYFDALAGTPVLAAAYKAPFPVVARALARAATLPLLLAKSITYSARDSLPGSAPPSYVDPAAKLAFWILFTYFVFPVANTFAQFIAGSIGVAGPVAAASATGLLGAGDLEKAPAAAASLAQRQRASNFQLGMQIVALMLAATVPPMVVPSVLRTFVLDSGSSVVTRCLLSIFDDYWVMVVSLCGALFSCTQVYPVAGGGDRFGGSDAATAALAAAEAVSPGAPLFAAAGLALVGLVDVAHYTFAYYLPQSTAGVTHPISYVDRHQEPFELLLAARGQHYSAIAHAGFVLVGALIYIVLRLGILTYTRVAVEDDTDDQVDDHGEEYAVAGARRQAPAKHRYYYMGCWIWLARCSYELLELRAYIFLAASGTVRLHYLPTGAIHSSLLTRTFRFVDGEFEFPYLRWRVAGKLRTAATLALAAGVFVVVADWCAGVWDNTTLSMQGPAEGEVVEEAGVHAAEMLEKTETGVLFEGNSGEDEVPGSAGNSVSGDDEMVLVGTPKSS